MCGICGVNEHNPILLESMLSALRHRGPDHTGRYINENFSLGMQRLSIIDLKSGNQPIWNEDQSICVFMNGEIYNFRELRTSLTSIGHQFKTESDTEVLVHLYEEYGTKMPGYLKGMFAFCIYDVAHGSLFLGRDRFGEKPLYYVKETGRFIFSSEMHSLLVQPTITRMFNNNKLNEYLKFGFMHSDLTLSESIKSLKPGHWALFKNNTLQIKEYFQLDYSGDHPELPEQHYTEKTKELLITSVQSQMISDVPVGAFLSGGIDSSSIAAIMQSLSEKKISTFNVRFEESGYDESRIARSVARYIGSDHHELFVPNQSFSEELYWEILTHQGHPFVDSSTIPSYLVSKEISKHVKVALSGDGGDELFAGYNDLQWGLRIEQLRSLPAKLRNIASSALKFLPNSGVFLTNTQRGLQKAIDYSLLNKKDQLISMYSFFDNDEIQALTGTTDFTFTNIDWPDRFSEWTALRQLMWMRSAIKLPHQMLYKVDRMSMGNSLEVRTPFLDVDLFEFSKTIPDDLLIRHGKGKWILRNIMKKQLPKEVYSHPKQGFSLPLHHFINKEFEYFILKLIRKNHPLFELLDYHKTVEIVQKGLLIKKSDSQQSIYKITHRMWIIAQLFSWFDRYGMDLQPDNRQA